jgi:prophage regulatory protein
MKFVRYEDLARFGITWSRVHLDRLQRAGQFPRKIKIGANTVVYLESEIVAWIEARCKERGAA